MTLYEMHTHFACVYGRRNRIFLPGLRERIDFLNLAISDLQDAVRKSAHEEALEIALARIVSRIFCIVEHFYRFPFVQMMSKKYPAQYCSYCSKLPCACPERRLQYQLNDSFWVEQRIWSLADWCHHFNVMYGARNKEKGIENLLNRLFRETGELLSVQMGVARMSSTLDEIEEAFALELADTLAWTIAVANFLGIHLEKAVLKRFESGCRNCHQISCVCTHFNVDPVRW